MRKHSEDALLAFGLLAAFLIVSLQVATPPPPKSTTPTAAAKRKAAPCACSRCEEPCPCREKGRPCGSPACACVAASPAAAPQSFAFYAPAPLAPRRAPAGPPAPVPERCLMLWRGVAYRAEFRPGGAYLARPPYAPTGFEGTWRYDVGSRVLEIRERAEGVPEGAAYAEYRVRLSGRPGEIAEGTFEGDDSPDFSLSRLPARD